MGAYAMHAKHDTEQTTANARKAMFERFEREVDPDGVLAPEERARRAEAARKAYMTGLALRSSVARRQNKK